MGPFFKFVLAESWGCPGMLRMPSGFKACGFSPTGYKRFRVCLTPVPSRVRIPSLLSPHKKGPQMGPFFQVILAESWGFEPQMPFWGILA